MAKRSADEMAENISATPEKPPYFDNAERYVKGLMFLGFRSRHVLEHDQPKGQRLIFEQQADKIARDVNEFAQKLWESIGYSMEHLDGDYEYQEFCNKKKSKK